MRFLDTNVFVRYLTRDDEAKAAACFELFQRLKQGTEAVATCEAVITEIVYVLSSRAHYHLSHEEIGARLRPILALKGLKLAHKKVYLHALDLYASYPFADFEDVLIVAHMESQGVEELLSYDTDFDRIGEIKRLEP